MQDIRSKIKVVAAALAGGLFLGATMAGAVAADLGTLPTGFADSSGWKAQIVVGQNAKVADVIAAAQVAAAFAPYTVTATTTGAAEITTGDIQEIPIGGQLVGNWKSSFKDNDIPKLLDTEISFRGDTYDIHEEIDLGSGMFLVTGVDDFSGVTNADDYGSDVGAKVYLNMTEGDLEYKYVFDDAINTTEIDENHPLRIKLLGMDLEIVGAGSNYINVKIGTEKILGQGESATVGDYTVTVNTIGESSVALSVSGACSDSDFVSAGDTWEACGGDVKIKVDSILYVEAGSPDNKVKLSVGTDIIKKYTTGDAFIGYEDEDTPTWKWDISLTGTSGSDYIGVKYGKDVTSMDDSPITVGGQITFPNDYVVLKLLSYTTQDYGLFEVKFDSSEDIYANASASNPELDNKPVIIFDGPEDDSFSGGGHESEKIAIHWESGTAYIAYWDADENKWIKAAQLDATSLPKDTGMNLVYGDTSIDIWLVNQTTTNATNIAIKLNGTNIDTLLIDPNDDLANNLGLGATPRSAETSEVQLAGDNIGTLETDVMSHYGIIVLNPNNNGDSDKVLFKVPAEQVKVKTYVGAPIGGTVEAEGAAYTYAAITSEVAVMDSEANTNQPVIIVGGPYANSLAAQLIGTDDATIRSFFGADEGGLGIVKLYDATETPWNQPALLVAGWSADQTRAAAYVLSQYMTGVRDKTELTGKTTIKVTASTPTSIGTVTLE